MNEKKKLNNREMLAASCILGGAGVDEEGRIWDGDLIAGECEAPALSVHEDHYEVDLKMTCYKPLHSITCDIVVDRSKDDS